jgi:uncharacterized protein YbjT (DUF2867 family)
MTEVAMILVTGGTGKTGFELIEALAGQAVNVRAMVRDPSRATNLQLPHVTLVAGDFKDTASLDRALSGCEQAFLVSPPVENLHELEIPFIDAAKRAGVKHIVKLSAVGAAADAPHRFGRWHFASEQHLRDSGLDFTILRANFFMQNLLGAAGMIKSGTIYMPTGEGRAPLIDVRDIAAVAEACLTEDGHEDKLYDLTGPAALSYQEIAETFARLLKRPVRFVDVPPETARQSMIDAGFPAWQADAINELNAEMKAGHLGIVTDHVEEVGHKQPITLEQFIGDHLSAFN